MAILFCVMLSYVLFVHYIRKIGNETLRYKTVLELAHTIQKTLVPIISQRTARFEIYGMGMLKTTTRTALRDRSGGEGKELVSNR